MLQGIRKCRSFRLLVGRPTTTPLFAARRRKSNSSTTLEWESFEFSSSPKLDRRFDGDVPIDSTTTTTMNKHEVLNELKRTESLQDEKFASQLQATNAAWKQLDPEMVENGIASLLPYVTPERVERIHTVLRQRTQQTRFLFENPSNPSNVWACLRTIEAFGIQHVDLIVESAKFKGKQALAQKRGMRTAMGSAQWLSLAQYSDTRQALEELKPSHRIIVSDLQESTDIRDMDWDCTVSSSSNVDNRPLCIVMGNEEEGISEEMRQAADDRFRLPMVGFAESFNLSVATAITLAHLSAASSNGTGPLRPGDLPDQEVRCLLLKGLLNSVAQKRMAHILLKNAGLPPDVIRYL